MFVYHTMHLAVAKLQPLLAPNLVIVYLAYISVCKKSYDHDLLIMIIIVSTNLIYNYSIQWTSQLYKESIVTSLFIIIVIITHSIGPPRTNEMSLTSILNGCAQLTRHRWGSIYMYLFHVLEQLAAQRMFNSEHRKDMHTNTHTTIMHIAHNHDT